MSVYKFTIVFVPEKGQQDVYNVLVPAIPEIATCGDSLAEARFMAQDAIELVLLSRLEEGEEIPSDCNPTNIPKGAQVEEVLVTVSHEVRSTRVTDDVKSAFL